MEPQNRDESAEKGGIGVPAVTLRPKGNRFRPDAVILDELTEAVRRVDPARLQAYLLSGQCHKANTLQAPVF